MALNECAGEALGLAAEEMAEESCSPPSELAQEFLLSFNKG